jgi:hypothetical protein
MTQLDLFRWAESKPSNVIDARPRFEARVIAFVERMIITNQLPPHVDGQVIRYPRGAA